MDTVIVNVNTNKLVNKKNNEIRINIYQSISFIIALFYALFLSSLPLTVFKDRHNYLIYAEYSHDIIHKYLDSNILALFSNEPVWLALNIALDFFFSADITLRVIIFIPAFLVSYYTLRSEPHQFLWLLLILFVPNIIKNHIIHLRQGVAIACFLVAWFSKKKVLRIVLFSITPFIHSSFFFVMGLFVLTNLMLRMRLSPSIRILVIAFCSILTSFSLQWIASLLGARQANEYQFTGGEVSGLGFLFWLIILTIFCLQDKNFLREHAFEANTIVYYLGTYFFIEVTARVFESTLLLVLLAGLKLTGWRRIFYLALLLFFTLYSYYLRIRQPWLGWGNGI